MPKNNGARDLSRLAPFDPENEELLRVVVETPKGSRNKFAYNPEECYFVLRKALPAGMKFPYDFGFIPATKADDGDPLDVLVLMDEPAFPGCILTCRLIGVIEGEQRENGKKIRNDRVVAVEQSAHAWENIRTINDLGKQFAKELEAFFVNYQRVLGTEYRGLGIKGPGEARKLVKSALRQKVIRRLAS